MDDKSGNDDGKRGGDGERRGARGRGPGGASKGDFKPGGPKRSGKPGESRAGGRPSGDKPVRERREGARADGGERAERKPFRPREDRPGGEERGERKGFVPKSRGMFSHGGREVDGSQKRPKSYGRIAPEGSGEGGERKPRNFSDRPRREDRPAREDRPMRDERPRRDDRAPSGETAGDGSMRIAKRLARAGIASRRDAEGMIADGRVRLNGKLLDSPAVDVKPSDRIEVDGAPLPAIERTRLWLFHKPGGLVTTNRDPEGRPTVFDRLPEDLPRVLSVGRLDINTEGLLLLTNDGGLARVLELPATGWLRRYRVRAHGRVEQAKLDELRQGIAIDGVFYGAVEATLDKEQGSNIWLTLGLREGKNREVKRILGHLGLEVNRLIRVSFGPFQLGELAEGAVMEIKGRTLRDQLGERLIEEAGADFDAPIVNTFSNKPVKAERSEKAEPGERKGSARSEWISASDGGRPNRKKFGAAKREDALGRLDTRQPRGADRGERGDRAPRGERPDRGPRPERGDRPFGERKPKSFGPRGDKSFGDKSAGDDARPARRPADAPKRTANVWMAPGARAVGEKKKAEREERDRLRGEGGVSRGPRPAAGGAPRKPRPAEARPPRGDKPRRPER
ncbi:pseudouridine synthase [Aureimonas mangrovi]|uniref:pseudouridine synthase n=1 Tax=Aureimonas mangrovi TaxID=2758041 RepID=UPI001FE25B17|nr:pseudouridine synthase [Aureimonas mangrovi]